MQAKEEFDEFPDEVGATPLAKGTLPKAPQLFAFYDGLRARILAFLERRGARLKPAVADALLLVPDVFFLLVRLMVDHQVPARTRALIGGTLAYFVLPVDLLPEAMVGPAGFLDDLILALAVLAQSFGDELEPFTAKYWSGNKSLRHTMSDILSTADSLLSADLYDRLRGALSRRGIDLDDVQEQAATEPR